MTRVFLSIGSNLGSRIGNCRAALLRLSGVRGIIIIRKSGFYAAEPWGGAPGRSFINCAVELKTSLRPLELLGLLKFIEREIGRQEGSQRPRLIDLDIIFYGDMAVRTRGLVVPHPLAHERAFVLMPLMDIAPGFIHPVLKKDVRRLLSGVKGRAGVRRLDTLIPHCG